MNISRANHIILRVLINFLDDAHKHKRKSGPQLSRKEVRKQGRQGKKQRKAEFFTTGPAQSNSTSLSKSSIGKRGALQEHPDSPQSKKRKVSQPSEARSSATAKAPSASHVTTFSRNSSLKEKLADVKGKKGDRSTTAERQASRSEKKSKTTARIVVPPTRKEDEDDVYIAYLESKLGYKKGVKKTARGGQEDDGLDGTFQLACALRCKSLNWPVRPIGCFGTGRIFRIAFNAD